MNKDILFQMVANKRGGIDPALAIQSAIIETVNLPSDADCRVELDPTTHQYKIFRYWTVVEDPENRATLPETISANQLPLTVAKQRKAAVTIGDSISEEIHFSRIESQKFKRLFSTAMKRAERSQMAEHYRSQIEQLFIATVQRQQFNREGTILKLEEGS